jgi:hypothetical protein
MLLDRAGCDLLTIRDITGHSYRSAQTIVKHYRARNADRADAVSTGSNCRCARKGRRADQGPAEFSFRRRLAAVKVVLLGVALLGIFGDG